MGKLTKRQIELARSCRRQLRELAKGPSGAVNVVMPLNILRGFVDSGLATVVSEDRMGDVFAITKAGLAALAEGGEHG